MTSHSQTTETTTNKTEASVKKADAPLSSIASHTRKVALIKRSLLGIAFILVVALILWPQFRPIEKQLKLSFTKITEGESGKPQMQNPKFQGVDEHGQPYKIYADSATQESKHNVSLANITGDIALRENGWITFSADAGTVNLEKNEALLTGNVHILSDSEYNLKTESIEIFLKDGIASGHAPVTIAGPLGTLEASGFILDNNAKTVVFGGPVKTVLQPKRTDEGL